MELNFRKEIYYSKINQFPLQNIKSEVKVKTYTLCCGEVEIFPKYTSLLYTTSQPCITCSVLWVSHSHTHTLKTSALNSLHIGGSCV